MESCVTFFGVSHGLNLSICVVHSIHKFILNTHHFNGIIVCSALCGFSFIICPPGQHAAATKLKFGMDESTVSGTGLGLVVHGC